MNIIPWKHVVLVTAFYYVPTYLVGMFFGTVWFTSTTLLWINYCCFIPPIFMMGLSWGGFIGSIYFLLKYLLCWSFNRKYRHFSIKYQRGVDYKDVLYLGLFPTLLALAIIMPIASVMSSMGYLCEEGSILSYAMEFLNFTIDFILALIFTKKFLERRSEYIDYTFYM